MLYPSLVRAARQLSSASLTPLPVLDEWRADDAGRRRRWLDMLGLDPLPARGDLQVTVTGVVERENHVIEKLHFQPVPGCRVAGNLYRPRHLSEGARLPAVIYVCGHAGRGKCHYQEHPRWFGSHGYVCLILDAIQIGENSGFHHGTHRNGWWHWISQGYTPAGVEVWAAMRAADYLQSRPDVDPARLGITGNSGGGTVSWFTGAADPRFRVVVPSCQTGTMYQHVRDRTVDGHCDCTFWVNTCGWDFTDVAALIAPRPLLVCAATEDTLFRPYAFRDLVHRVRYLYRLFERGDCIELVEGIHQHGYSPKTRLAIFNWFERHLKESDETITEDVDAADETDDTLWVYPDGKAPDDDRMGEVDRFFIPLQEAAPLDTGATSWESARDARVSALRSRTFRCIPDPVPAPDSEVRRQGMSGPWTYWTVEFESEPGLDVAVQLALPKSAGSNVPVLLGPASPDARTTFCASGSGMSGVDATVAGYGCVEVRGTGRTSIGPGLLWTVRRAYPLVGQSLYERKTYDLLRAAQAVRQLEGIGPVHVYGRGPEAAVAIYAALLDASIAGVVLEAPVETHWTCGPEFPGVLRVGDLAENAALLCPRQVAFIGTIPPAYAPVQQMYSGTANAGALRVIPTLGAWRASGSDQSDTFERGC